MPFHRNATFHMTTPSIEYYSDNPGFLDSPPLKAHVVKSRPSPSPPPKITQEVYSHPQRYHNVTSSSNKRGKGANRPKTRPSHGDWVLVLGMDPNRPDIAQQVSENALDSESGSDVDDMMEEDSPQPTYALPRSSLFDSSHSDQPRSLSQLAQEVLDNAIDYAHSKSIHRDSVVEDDDARSQVAPDDRRSANTGTRNLSSNCERLNTNDMASVTWDPFFFSTASPNHPTSSQGTPTNGHAWESFSVTSSCLQQLTISQSRGSAMDTLPALQTQSPARHRSVGTPSQQLPSFRHMDDIARSATSDHDANRSNSIVHRTSISSVGQSPTSIARQLSISSLSPATPFPPLNASSPISANSDIFLRSGGGGVFGIDARRSSHPAEGGPYSTARHSSSTSESYQSSEGPSPPTGQTPIENRPRHLSLDGALRVLPPPLNSGIQHITSHSSGTFKCDYHGCTAPPFQTQYLLNSHANVHSQSRPHYCLVAGCSRSEGGRGFKRKNEMIRHGLVHQSPGYICPFCPDREHKYPRPDNLQRHVRVHHVDKDKHDPVLRAVLTQRPEGGSRGRGSQVSDIGH